MSACSLRYSCVRCFDYQASVRAHVSVREAVDMWLAQKTSRHGEGSARSAKGLEAYVTALRDASWVIYGVFAKQKFHPSRIDWARDDEDVTCRPIGSDDLATPPSYHPTHPSCEFVEPP